MSVGNVSVGALFIAAILPGLLFTAGFLVMTWHTTRRHNYGRVMDRPPFRELVKQTFAVLPLLFLPVVIVGGIVLGVFTVTESAGIGVVYTLIIGFFSKPQLKLKDIYDSIIYSAIISSVVGMLLATGAVISWLFAFDGVTQTLADFLTSVTNSPTIFLLLVMVALLLLGMVMDAVPIMVAIAPLLAPIAAQYGVPDVQFGLIFIVASMVGIVHPPAGVILFMTASLMNISVERLSLAILPFVGWLVLVVVLMILFPGLTTWLPALLKF
jgi:tripartite ATP-independent transporter DctM subunit